MLVIKVDLHDANTGEVRTLEQMVIYNDEGGTATLGNYVVLLDRSGRRTPREIFGEPDEEGEVRDHLRLSEPVWVLVRKAIESVGM